MYIFVGISARISGTGIYVESLFLTYLTDKYYQKKHEGNWKSLQKWRIQYKITAEISRKMSDTKRKR